MGRAGSSSLSDVERLKAAASIMDLWLSILHRYDVAMLAAGGALEALAAVMEGRVGWTGSISDHCCHFAFIVMFILV